MPFQEPHDYPTQLGGLGLPFAYEGPLTEERHGCQMNGLLIDGQPALLHELIGSTEPLAVRITVTRRGYPKFTYEGRVKVHKQKLLLLDPDPANPAADWVTLEDELRLSFVSDQPYATLRIESAID